MMQLQQLIKPIWGVEKWLNSAWAILDDDEKRDVSKRIDDMFYSPLPFQLKHDKSLYIHLFALLTQLEIFGLQGLLKSLEKLPEGDLKYKFRQQIVDEIFHAIVFAKLTFELSAPFALPPTHSKGIEKFLSHLVNEHDLKTSLVLINLVAEGWIEEIFIAMQTHKIAPAIFDVVLADESRHLEDSDLFLQIGLPDSEYLAAKLSAFEEELISMIFSEHIYVPTLINFLGVPGAKQLFNNIDKKQRSLLEKVNLTPSEDWQFFMKNVPALIEEVFHDQSEGTVIEQTSTRQVFTSLWDDPSQPTQSSVFSIDVTPIDFFEKKYPPETLTCLMLQTLSQAMENQPLLKNYMCHHKIYNPNDSLVGLGVLLPNSDDHLAMIEFKNCHNMHIIELAEHIQHDMRLMVYCHQRSQALKKEHPYLMDKFNEVFAPRSEHFFRYSFTARPTISLSNIGHWGYDVPVSPLFPNETVKLTLGKVDKKQVWNNRSKSFEVKDILPVGISVDHRVFDANIPVPKLMQTAFNQMLKKMYETPPPTKPIRNAIELDEFVNLTERLIKQDLEFSFRALFFGSHLWRNHTGIRALMSQTEGYLDKQAKEEATT